MVKTRIAENRLQPLVLNTCVRIRCSSMAVWLQHIGWPFTSVIDRQGGEPTKANRRFEIARVELTRPFAAKHGFLGVRALAAVRLEGVFDAWRSSR